MIVLEYTYELFSSIFCHTRCSAVSRGIRPICVSYIPWTSCATCILLDDMSDTLRYQYVYPHSMRDDRLVECDANCEDCITLYRCSDRLVPDIESTHHTSRYHRDCPMSCVSRYCLCILSSERNHPYYPRRYPRPHTYTSQDTRWSRYRRRMGMVTRHVLTSSNTPLTPDTYTGEFPLLGVRHVYESDGCYLYYL